MTFAGNVMGPFLFTQLLLERMQQSGGMVLHVIAPFHREIDWDDLESITDHKTNDRIRKNQDDESDDGRGNGSSICGNDFVRGLQSYLRHRQE